MNKIELLESLKKIKRYHEFQTLKVKDLVLCKEVFDLTPPNEEDCLFGKWLTNPDHNLKILLGSIFYKGLVDQHASWHKEYKNICDLFFPRKNFQDDPKKLSQQESEKCKIHYEQINTIENQIARTMKSCERRISALSDDKFSD